MRPLRRPTGAPSTRRPGFTLVEIVVVTIVLGLIASAVMISWEALLPNQKLNSAIRHLSETLYGTRSDAIARNREFRVYYDIDRDFYWVRTPFREGGGFAIADEEPRILVREMDLAKEGVEIVEVTIDDNTYTDGVVYVRFDPLGAASYHTVVLEQPIFERMFTIEALPLTGEIRFHDGYFQRELAEEGDFK